MKKLISALFAIAFASSALAAPFLESASVTNTAPVGENNLPANYVITGLGSSSVTTPATVNSNGSVQLKYDLSGLANGSYSVTVAASNSSGSSAAVPFTFVLPIAVTPAAPSGLSLFPQ